MQWSPELYAWRVGDGCPSCAEGRAESTAFGVGFYAGELRDAYLVRADIQRGCDVLGNSVPHLHTHIVPSYADDPRPGWPFPFPDPEPLPMPEDRLLADVQARRRVLQP